MLSIIDPVESPHNLDQWPTGRLLSAVAGRIEREWNTHLARWGLNHASFPVLYLLVEGSRSQRQLADASRVTEQTMSRIVARLERSGYVHRRSHPRDRRRRDVVLTDAGRRTLIQAGRFDVAERMSVRGLDAEQIDRLRALLTLMLVEHPYRTEHDHDPSREPEQEPGPAHEG